MIGSHSNPPAFRAESSTFVLLGARFAGAVNEFCTCHLNPYLNFHRPCLFAEDTLDAKGKISKRYPQHLVMTPFEKLLGIDNSRGFLGALQNPS